MTDIVVPQVGETTGDLTLTRWLKSEGDDVRKGDPLFEIDADKYTVEIEAFADGVLIEILVPDETVVTPQQVVGRLRDAAGERDVPPAPSAAAAAPPAPAAEPLPPPPAPGTQGRVMASPKARRLAADLGVDLASIRPVRTTIEASDVEAAALLLGDGGRAQPLSRHRRAVARSMQASKQTVPHFYLAADVDMGEAAALRERCRALPGWDGAPSFNDLVVLAAARAVRRHPEANAAYSDGGLLARASVNVGIAVATADGLVVGVVREADRLGLRELSVRLRELSLRARAGRLHADDLAERSLVVSNLGMHEVDVFFPIIDMPDPMIVGVGRVRDRCVPWQDGVAVRPTCTLTISADHRALDGVLAARVLAAIGEELTQAGALLEPPAA